MVTSLLRAARRRRWLNLCVVNLRILIGFAFLPAGLKKVLGQPFTDPDNVGVFHDFLHALHATGPFYRFIGVVQLVAAMLLMTQTFALLGAALILPVLTAIAVFCWATAGVPTIVTVTAMLLGTVGLLIWDLPRWRGLLVPADGRADISVEPSVAGVELGLWRVCGLSILGVYGLACALHGGVYRPRGVELDEPSFFLLPALALVPIVTYFIDRSRSRQRMASR